MPAPERLVVVNTTPIITLTIADPFPLSQPLSSQSMIPSAVQAAGAEARHSSLPWQGSSPAKTHASSRPSRAPGPHLRHTARNGAGTVDHQS